MGVNNKLTIATQRRLAAAIQAPTPLTAGRALTPADHGKVLAVSVAMTVTIPQDLLPAGFEVFFIAPASGNLSVDPLGTVTVNGAGTTLTRARAANFDKIRLYVNAANATLLSGA